MATVVVIAMVWFVGWGWHGHGGWLFSGPGVPKLQGRNQNGKQISTFFNTETSGSGLKILNSIHKQDFVGQSFQLEDAPVQTVVNQHAFWVGETLQNKMLVILPPGELIANNSNGHDSWVNVSGTVKKAPPQQEAQQEWGLTSEAASTLEQQGVYVLASNLQTRSR